MKSTDSFKKVIEAKLQEMAVADTLFAANLQKADKNIDDCITFILNSVHKSGCNGFTDEEIFGMAAHYYDEDGIKVGSQVNCKVVINQVIELSAEEKSLARKTAIEQAIALERDKFTKKAVPKKAELAQVAQPTLF
jgi:hypothetical protein